MSRPRLYATNAARATEAWAKAAQLTEVHALRATAGNPTPSGHNQYTPKQEEANSDNVMISSKKQAYGNSTAYLLARLKRDAPAIFAAVERGEYRSARAAAKAAGLVHDTPPLVDLRRAWRKASQEERRVFLAEVEAGTINSAHAHFIERSP